MPGELTHDDHEMHVEHYSFSATSLARTSAPPISLLSLVDQEEYVILPNSTSLSAVRMKDLDPRHWHTVRIIAPMIDNGGHGALQMDGLWLDKGGQLLPVEGSIADTTNDDMDDPDDNAQIGDHNRLGLGSFLRGKHQEAARIPLMPVLDENVNDANGEFKRRKKLVEVVTDSPAHFGRRVHARKGGADGLLAGVMGWEYLLGEMFSVDHVCIGVENMCLMQSCVGGSGTPSGLGDVFFRRFVEFSYTWTRANWLSGPVDSPHFGHPWPFQSYAPDVLVSLYAFRVCN